MSLATMTFSGGVELERALAELPNDVARRTVMSGLRKSSGPLLATMRANAQNMVGGDMGASISADLVVRSARRNRRRPAERGVSVQIDPKASSRYVYKPKGGGRDTYIPNAIEFGHVAPDGSLVAPISFARSAFDSQKEGTLSRMIRELWASVERSVKRLARKARAA